MKIVRTFVIITITIFLVWLLCALTFAVINPDTKELPKIFTYPLIILSSIWILIAVGLLIKNFKYVKTEISNFINKGI